MKLYIGNLPYQTTESDIQDWFAQAGVTADSVSLVRDRFTGEPRGFGFVEIQDNAAAEAAIRACNGKQLMGRAVVVNEARPQAPRPGGGGKPKSGSGGRGGPRRAPRW
jgi:RNA recognition motif-containing protein